MSSNSKLMPNLDERSTKMLNLTVLQRIDPRIEEILITAAHVTLYEFNVDLNQWSRKEVEGSFFVVKRSAQPRFQFIVMNRRSAENMVEDLLGDFEFEVQVPYLLYRNAAQEVNGIWFYNAHEIEEVADLFGRILGEYSKVPLKPQLRKSEFTDHEVVPMSTAIEGTPGPAFTTSTDGFGADDSSFMNFFNSAATIGHTSSTVVNSGLPYHYPVTTFDPSPRVPSPLPSPAPISQVSLPVQSAPSPPRQSRRDSANLINSSNYPANLVKPSFFTPPVSPVLVTTSVSSATSTPVLYPHVNPQRPHGTLLVQPFRTPTSPPFLTSTQIPKFVAPCYSMNKIEIDTKLPIVGDQKWVIWICSFNVPMAPGKTRSIVCSARNFFQFTVPGPAWWQVFPRWQEHWTSNKVYDGDMIVLQGQEKVFLSKSKENGTDVNKEYTKLTFTPTQADRFVLAFRNWLRRHGNSQPEWFGSTDNQPLPSTVLSKRQMMDRFEQHTLKCSSCRKAYYTFEKLQKLLIGSVVVCCASAGIPADVNLRIILGSLAIISAGLAYVYTNYRRISSLLIMYMLKLTKHII